MFWLDAAGTPLEPSKRRWMAPIIYTLWINWMVQLAASGEGLQAKLPLDDLVEQCHAGIRCWFDTDLTHRQPPDCTARIRHARLRWHLVL